MKVKRVARKISACLNEVDKLLKTPVIDESGWEALIDDIDLQIEALMTRCKELKQVREVAVGNLKDRKSFPWGDFGQPDVVLDNGEFVPGTERISAT